MLIYYDYLYMKSLYSIYESLLDDDTTMMKDAEHAAYNAILKGLDDYRLANDGKHIIFDPTPEDSLVHGTYPSLRGAENGLRNHWEDINKIKRAGLIFQPIQYLELNIPGDEDGIDTLPCEGVYAMELNFYSDKSVDLSKLNYPIFRLINISKSYMGKVAKVIAPSKHIPVVEYDSLYDPTGFLPEDISGWDCDELYVPYQSFFDYYRYSGLHDDMQYTKPDKVQELVSNNPKAKNIYLTDNQHQIYYKCSFKGSGKNRKVIKLIPKKKRTVDTQRIRDGRLVLDQHIWGWKAKNLDLWDK